SRNRVVVEVGGNQIQLAVAVQIRSRQDDRVGPNRIFLVILEGAVAIAEQNGNLAVRRAYRQIKLSIGIEIANNHAVSPDRDWKRNRSLEAAVAVSDKNGGRHVSVVDDYEIELAVTVEI